MPVTRRRVVSANEMRALAHPVRLEVLELLSGAGPMTASDAAARLNQTPANVSWHLRKLAEHGFVRQATEGRGRRRPWKVVAESLAWGDDSDYPAAASALQDVAVEREVQLLRAALSGRDTEPSRWREATSVHQARLWLTADEAVRLGAAIHDLVAATARRLDDPERRPPGARLTAFMAWVVPWGPIEAGPGAQDAGAPRP